MNNPLDVINYGNAKDIEDKLADDPTARRIGDELDQQSWEDATNKLFEETEGMYPRRNLGGRPGPDQYRWASREEAAGDIRDALNGAHEEGRTYDGWVTAARRKLGLPEATAS